MKRRIALTATTALAPFVVLFVRATRGYWMATADYSLIAFRTRQVGGGDTPLIGPYSRFGWSHPGPTLYFALAAPFRLFATYGSGLLAGASVIGAVAVVTIVVVLLRAPVPRLVSLFGLLVTAALLRGLGGAFLWDPWNPRVIVLPFLAFVLLSWWAATGHDRALPFAVAYASFITQSHVALVPEVVALLVLAIVWLRVTMRTAPERSRLRRSILISTAVFAVMWLPPVIEELQPHGGNLSTLFRFWTRSHSNTVGYSHGARLLAPQFSIPATWMTGHEQSEGFGGALSVPRLSIPFALLLLIAASVAAWRRRDRVGMAACSFAATSAFVAWISVANVVDTPFEYVLRWDWVVGATCWIAAGIALLPIATERLRDGLRDKLAYATAAGAAVLLTMVTMSSIWAAKPLVRASEAAHALTVRSEPDLRKLPRPLLMQADVGSDVVAVGVISGLVERGIDTRYPKPLLTAPGTLPVRKQARAGTLVFVAVDAGVDSYARDPRFHEIASFESDHRPTAGSNRWPTRAAVFTYVPAP